jgi:hypothetical protein
MSHQNVPQNTPQAAQTSSAQPTLSEGFQAASKELTLSAELIAELPKSVRSWKPEHVLKWLHEVFAGARDLPR